MDSIFCIYAVGAIIKRKIENETYVLIQERYKGEHSSETGLIEVPCGKVKPAESPFDVIRKKVQLETGLIVSEIQGEKDITSFCLNNYKTISFVPFYVSHNLETNYSLAIEFFICETIGEHCKNTSEAKNIRWISIKDLQELLINYPELFYPMVYEPLKKYCETL